MHSCVYVHISTLTQTLANFLGLGKFHSTKETQYTICGANSSQLATVYSLYRKLLNNYIFIGFGVL